MNNFGESPESGKIRDRRETELFESGIRSGQEIVELLLSIEAPLTNTESTEALTDREV